MFVQTQTVTFSKKAYWGKLVVVVVVPTLMEVQRFPIHKMKTYPLKSHTQKIWVLIISSASFHLLSLSPPGSMTRQESPSSTLFHYGEHWWPLDRQPKKRLPSLPTPPPPPTTPTSQPTPPKSSSRKGRRLLQGPHTGNKVQQKSPELIILFLHYVLCRK